MENNRTRDGQYELTLRRDVIADNLDVVLDATTYIEKGDLDVNNPLIFNKEGMLFNQIKVEEDQLRDASNCAWLVGYISKDATASDVTINYSPANQNYLEVSAATIAQWFLQQNITPGTTLLGEPYNITYKTFWQAGLQFVYNYNAHTAISGAGSFSTGRGNSGNSAIRAVGSAKKNEVGNLLLTAYNIYGMDTFKNALINLVGAHSANEITNIKNFNGKTIKTQDGKYYNISVKVAPATYVKKDVSLSQGNDL